MFHEYTCPEINKQMSRFKRNIRDILDGLIEDQSEFDNAVDGIYDIFEDCFEEVRSTNSSLRESAEREIEELEEKLKNVERDMVDECDTLEKTIDEQRERISYLESELELCKLDLIYNSFKSDNM